MHARKKGWFNPLEVTSVAIILLYLCQNSCGLISYDDKYSFPHIIVHVLVKVNYAALLLQSQLVVGGVVFS